MIEKTSLEKNSRHLDFRPLIAFFVTLFASFLMFANVGITPFGTRNIMTSDLAAQYGPYLVGLRNALKRGESLLYSQAQGMGQNTMGLFAYYLSSPLNLIVLLFPKNYLQEAISIMICVKLAFAGSFMTWLLGRKFNTKSKLTIIFGLMYPMCSFVLTFIFNIMWLDGIVILPLLILAVDEFIENRRKWPILTLVLFLLFVSGYYMAYMVGIFSFLYLICVMGYQGRFSGKDSKENGKTVGWFILSAVVAAMMSAAILLPAGLDTIRNGDYTKKTALTLDPEFSLKNLVDQFMANGVPDLSSNLPYFFCGLSALFLFLLFFFNPTITKKLKKAIAAVSLAFLLSFQIPILNRAWHLFDEPNWFNFRYSYLFSFVMILVAFYSFLNLKGAGKKDFLRAYGVIVALCVISQSFGEMAKKGNIFFATLLFLTLETVILYGLTLDRWPEQISNLRKYGAGFLVAVILVEVAIFNTQRYLPNVIGKSNDANEFPTMLDHIDALAENIDRSTWSRTEIENSWHGFITANTLPDYIDTRSISSFASMANKKTNHFMKQFGYETNYNYFFVNHVNTIDPVDSMLGIRYILTSKDTLRELKFVAKEDDQYYLYENPYALPIAYLVESDAGAFDAYALEKDLKVKDYFAFQENWIQSLSGLNATNIYDTFYAEWTVLNGERTDLPPMEDATVVFEMENSLNQEPYPYKSDDLIYYYKNNDKTTLTLRTEITITDSAPLYFLVPYAALQCDAEIYVDNKLIAEQGSSDYSQILALGSYDIGQTITVDVRVSNKAMACYEPIFAYCHIEEMTPHYEKLASTVQDFVVEDGHVTFTTSSDTDKLLLTTIPFEDGWEAWVDGQKVEQIAYQDALISIPLSSGTHNIELRFTPPGFKVGVVATAVGVVLFVALSVIVTRKKKNSIETISDEAETAAEHTTITTCKEEKS